MLITRKAVFGVKGSSSISLFVFKPIRTTGIDTMHCVFLGLTNQLLTLWFDKKYSDKEFSIYHAIKLVDSRILSLTPPSYIQRRPRSIENHLGYWKASELKNWFFNISLIVLEDLLPPAYYNHHKLIVLTIFLLSKSSISAETDKIARRIIHKYLSQFEDLYGKEHLSSNLHQLSHLDKVVKDFGPLWTLSCFTYENMNGTLKNLVHSSNSAQLQICTSLFMLMQALELNNSLRENSPAYLFCKRLTSVKKQRKCCKIGDNLYIIGTSKRVVEEDNELWLLNITHGKNVFKFYRFQKNKYFYSSEAYTRQTVTSSKCVKYYHNNDVNYGFVKYYFKITECNYRKNCLCNGKYYAMIKKMSVVDNVLKTSFRRINESYLYKCLLTDDIDVIEVQNLLYVCFFIQITGRDDNYVIEPINSVEVE